MQVDRRQLRGSKKVFIGQVPATSSGGRSPAQRTKSAPDLLASRLHKSLLPYIDTTPTFEETDIPVAALGASVKAHDMGLRSASASAVLEALRVRVEMRRSHEGDNTPPSSEASSSPPPQRPVIAVDGPTWEAQQCLEHSDRLHQAAAKASKPAARKMLALAATEQLRSTSPTAALYGRALARRSSSERSLLGHRSSYVDLPAHLEEDVATSVASATVHDFDGLLAGRRTTPPPPSPWECLVLGLHSLLGCDARSLLR